MPLYEYQCQSCGSHSEVVQRFSDPPLTTCDECGGELKKLISAPAFQFKGEGWYVTDYARKDEKGKDKKAAGKDTGTSSEKAKESGDSKPKETGGETKAERSAKATIDKSSAKGTATS